MGPQMKIAVLRANALGDLVFSLPALEALRAEFPSAEIVLLGRQWHVTFLGERPSPVDRVVAVPGDEWPDAAPNALHGDAPWLAATPAERRSFRAAMRAEAFDIAIQVHGGGRNSNPFLTELGAALTVGLRSPDAPALDRWVPYVYYQQEVARCLEVMALLDARPVSIAPHIELTEADRQAAREAMPIDHPAPLAVLHPGALDPRRRWPADRFAALGDRLASEGLRIVLTGTEAEAPITRAVAAAMAASALDLAGRTSMGGLAGIIERASLVVSNDSGPLHLATALRAPTVGIYWCGNMINGGPLTRARHRPVISWRTTCPRCGVDCTRTQCDHRDSFVAEVEVEEVAAAARDLLATAASVRR